MSMSSIKKSIMKPVNNTISSIKIVYEVSKMIVSTNMRIINYNLAERDAKGREK